MPDNFEFGVTLNAREPLDADSVSALFSDVLAMLKDIERAVTNRRPSVEWRWGPENAQLSVVASVNGLNAVELGQIVDSARQGFARANDAARHSQVVSWPAEFGVEARKRAASILRQLENLESLTVDATNHEPLVIREARIDQIVRAKGVRRVYSSVEGVLELISHKGPTVRAGVREHRTNRYVQCSFSAEDWLEPLKDGGYWDKRVVIEGRVAYNDDGEATSVVDVTRIDVREPGRPLREFEGSAPDLTGGVPTDDFVARLRDG